MKKLLFLFLYSLLPNYALPQNCQGNCVDGDGTYTYATGAIYTGSWEDGKRSGLGRTISSNGEEYVGNYSNNSRSGYGEYSFPSGEVYKGNWSESKRSGYGSLLYQNGVTKYEGNFSDGKINGFGIKTYYNGAIYEGEWLDGVYFGLGKFSYINGDIYEGEFENDRQHGKGRLTFSNGDIYEGEFENGKYQGFGKFIYVNGNKFEGMFENGESPKSVTFNFANGDIYIGNILNHRVHGEGTLTKTNGDIYEGEFENDRQHGKGKLTFSNGNVYEGEFENGKLQGYGIYIYANDETYNGQFDIDKPHGQGIYKYEDGTKYEGEWINGEISGKGIFTYSDGRTYTPLPNDEDLIEISSGTGFFVNDKGYLVSSNHVIEICHKINTAIRGITYEINVINYDQMNDLALLKIEIENNSFISLSGTDAKLGESIMTAGFPWGDSQSNSIKVTKGNINALSGPMNNVSKMQFSAPVQPGNSGGPIINQYGKLIGVIQSMAKDQDIFEKTGQYPENVNFGTQLPPLRALLAANGIDIEFNYFDYFLDWDFFKSPISNESLATIAEQSTIHLRCLNTIEGRKKVISSDKINYLF